MGEGYEDSGNLDAQPKDFQAAYKQLAEKYMFD